MSTAAPTSAINVAIVGGGPSGLTLAAILKAIHIPFTVFELDPSRDARGQGGMLDIHKNSGQFALQKAGLFEEFKKRMRVDATDWYLRDHTGKVLWFHSEKEEEEPNKPEIDRAELRAMLLDALDEGQVQWGKKLVRAEKGDSADGGKFTLHFADGTSASGFDVLVGADGTWSRVRPLRSDVPPPYSGMTVVCTTIANIDERYPELAAFAGNGSCNVLDGKTMIMSQKNGDGSLRGYSYFLAPEDWKEKSGIDWSNQREGLEEFLRRFHPHFSDEAKAILLKCDEGELAIRPLYLYPPGYTLEKKCSGVTLTGDAAHVITPFTGTGVNLAMHDAYDLGIALEKVAFQGAAIDDALEEYETQSFARAGFWSGLCGKSQEQVLSGLPVDEIVAKMTAFFEKPE